MASLQFFRLALHALVFQQYIKMIKFISYNKNKTEGAKLNLVVVRKKNETKRICSVGKHFIQK